jgi:hypothetical protein
MWSAARLKHKHVFEKSLLHKHQFEGEGFRPYYHQQQNLTFPFLPLAGHISRLCFSSA